MRLSSIIADIPLILEQAEMVYTGMESPSYNPNMSSPTVAANALKSLWDRISAVEAELQRWEYDTVRSSHEGSPAEGLGGADAYRIPPQSEYTGPTLEPATTLCVYYAARLLLAHVDRRPSAQTPPPRPSPGGKREAQARGRGRGGSSSATTPSTSSAGGSADSPPPAPASPDQVLRWAVAICHVAADRAGHVREAVTAVVYLFALRVAYFSFPELSNGRKWVEGLFDRVAVRFGMPLARSILTHLPGPDGPALQEFTA